jgi:hypothetical protein
MYTLTLTRAERNAFDWIGDRYNAGEVYRLLTSSEMWGTESEGEVAWDDDEDITFHIPEFVMWEIVNLAHEEDYLWPCFSRTLREKLNNLCEQVV